MTRHVFFDLDGTLTDSAPGITRCLAHAVRTVGGSPPDDEVLRAHIGTPMRVVMQALLEDDDASRIDEAIAAYLDRFGRIGIRENALYPGILEALQALRAADCALYVATAKRQRVAEQVIDHFELAGLFDGVFGTRDTAGIDTKQDVLRAGLESTGIPAAGASMVGDRHHDIDAARALGLRAIAVAWGYGPLDEIAHAHAVAHAPAALVGVVLAADDGATRPWSS